MSGGVGMTSRLPVLYACFNVLRALAPYYAGGLMKPNYKTLVSELRETFATYVPELGPHDTVCLDNFLESNPDLSLLTSSKLFERIRGPLNEFVVVVKRYTSKYSHLSEEQWVLVFFGMLSQVNFRQEGDHLLLKYAKTCTYVGFTLLAEACRGLSFVVNHDWTVSLFAWPYEKFYNLGEAVGVSFDELCDAVPDNGSLALVEKMDGCLIILSSRPKKGTTRSSAFANTPVVTTAGALDTEQAKFAAKYLRDNHMDFLQAFCRLPAGSMTFVFELVNTSFEPHVVPYARDRWGLYWLGTRVHSLGVGEMFPSEYFLHWGLGESIGASLLSLRRPSFLCLEKKAGVDFKDSVKGFLQQIGATESLTTEGVVCYAMPPRAGMPSSMSGCIDVAKFKTETFLRAQKVTNAISVSAVYDAYVSDILDSLHEQLVSNDGVASPTVDLLQLYLGQLRFVGSAIKSLCLEFESFLENSNLSKRGAIEVVNRMKLIGSLKQFFYIVANGTSASEVLIPFCREESSLGKLKYLPWSKFKNVFEYFIPDEDRVPSVLPCLGCGAVEDGLPVLFVQNAGK